MAVSRVANSDTFKVTTPSDREIVLTRLFDAPRHLVFEAMTKPEHVRRWWGILDDELLGPGLRDRSPRRRRLALRRTATPRASAAFYGVYREIAPPERVVFTEIFEPFPDVESVVTSVFTEEHGKTRLTVTALYPSKDVRDMVIKTGMEKGAGDQLRPSRGSRAGAAARMRELSAK